jgi:lipoprotein-anchoring transpeptidase ErfK/SrfK
LFRKTVACAAAASSVAFCFVSIARATETPAPPFQVLISVPDQRLALVKDGELVARFPVSTSRFGTGDHFGSYRTPLGDLKVCDKIGDNLTPGAVIRHRSATGEVLPVNAPGRDPIVTRLIWLDGLQPQNQNAHARGIYIHGTPEERTIGTPVSWGCIRMRSKDVIQVFNEVPVGTVVSIIPARLPHMHRYEPPKEVPTPEPAPGPSPAVSKPAPPEIDKPAVEKPATLVAKSKPASPLPPIAESPDHDASSAMRSMKGSILLANLPGTDSEKSRSGKATQ